ncbi:hypothetical protein LUZ60_017369 [Juncus effusus]|nr:hypothetical protein LUZ60_017369 [Juncus effusus]
MHGRPRKPAKQEDPAAAEAKSARLRELQSQLLNFHHNHIYTKDALLASSKLIEVNPEVYTAWNYRKLAFQHNLKDISDPESIQSAVQDELRIVELALRRNPKSYGAWYHRKWILGQKLVPTNFDQEFKLLNMLLKADARNFHGWNYRRFVARLKDVSEEEELKFTMDMINTNFSNYSAWHNRSMLLSSLLKKKSEGFTEKENILLEEFELVRQALFTDPSDQSGWFYHLWLLDQISISNNINNNNKPQLISSWPSKGSKIANFIKSRGQFENFPIVLYFDREIDGVNCSEIKANGNLIPSGNFTWKPVLVNNSKKAKVWTTNLNFLNIFEEEFGSLKECDFEINADYFENLKFKVELNYIEERKEGDWFEQPFLWNCPEKCDNLQEGPSDFNYLENSVTEGSNWNLNTLSDEIALFKEFAESEEDSKFVKLSVARLLAAYNSITFNENSSIERNSYLEEALKLFNDLIKLDPPHKRYYEDEISLLLFNQLTCSKESIMKYCCKFDKFELAQTCMKITKIPLTRIGFTERLLWVQALDLSHNNLRSISGLEALQRLICLNVSHNQIKSFSSLYPLKKLNFLKALDLSYNLIGAHTVDTTRYLCPSPLSYPFETKGILEELRRDNCRVEENWEAALFFKGMGLVQLELQGNRIAGEGFGGLVMKVVPSLKWFDGNLVC